MAFFVVYGILLVIVILAYFKTGIKLSLFNIFFGLFFLFYGPAFFIYNNDRNLFDTEYAVKSAILLSLFVISYFLGRYLFLINKKRSLSKKINYKNWIKLPNNRYFKVKAGLLRLLVIIIAAVIFAGLFFYGGVNSLATAISTPFIDEETITNLRLNSGVSGWIEPYYSYIITGIARLVSFVFIGWAFEKKSVSLKITAFAFALFVSIAYLANLSKSSFTVYFIQLFFFLFLLLNIKINYKKVFLIVSIIIPAFIFIYLITTNAENSSAALQLLAYRIFEEPTRVLELYPLFYPDIYPHTYGMNIRVIHELFADTKFVPANILVSGGQFENVTFNAMFISDAYVDFSYLGVIIQSIFVGYYLSFLDSVIFRKNNFIQKALFASLLVGIFTLINTGLVVSLFAYGLFTLPVFAYFLTKEQARDN